MGTVGAKRGELLPDRFHARLPAQGKRRIDLGSRAQKKAMTVRTRKMANGTWATNTEAPAMLPNPNAAATTARTNK